MSSNSEQEGANGSSSRRRRRRRNRNRGGGGEQGQQPAETTSSQGGGSGGGSSAGGQSGGSGGGSGASGDGGQDGGEGGGRRRNRNRNRRRSRGGEEGASPQQSGRQQQGGGHHGGGGGGGHHGGGGGGGGGSRRSTRHERRRMSLEELIARMSDHTAIQPNERIRLETHSDEAIGRLVDIITPIGKGQRCLITSPPKAGKTTILQAIARAVHENHPEIYQMALLIDERPEEATDFKRNSPATVVASTADQSYRHHIKAAERVFREAVDRMLDGQDVLILLDSITRLARAYNNASGSGGKILSGGITAGALDRPRQLFGAARKIEDGGSLTIVATALVETGSVMDEVIFQEFKGTGNLELILDRQLSQRRVFPAIHVGPSGTRKEHVLMTDMELRKIPALRRFLADMGKEEAMQWLVRRVRKTHNNRELLGSVNET